MGPERTDAFEENQTRHRTHSGREQNARETERQAVNEIEGAERMQALRYIRLGGRWGGRSDERWDGIVPEKENSRRGRGRAVSNNRSNKEWCHLTFVG